MSLYLKYPIKLSYPLFESSYSSWHPPWNENNIQRSYFVPDEIFESHRFIMLHLHHHMIYPFHRVSFIMIKFSCPIINDVSLQKTIVQQRTTVYPLHLLLNILHKGPLCNHQSWQISVYSSITLHYHQIAIKPISNPHLHPYFNTMEIFPPHIRLTTPPFTWTPPNLIYEVITLNRKLIDPN